MSDEHDIHILFVEDDRGIVIGLKRFFRFFPQFILHWAQSPQEGHAFLEEKTFDAVVADLDLEEQENGIAFLQHVQQNYPQALRILTSGSIKPREFVLSARQHYLAKPFDPNVLIDLLTLA